MIYASFKVIMIEEGPIESEINHTTTTTTYKSSELGQFFEHLISLIPSKYLGSIYLNTLVMQFHFTIIPKGGCGTVDRDLERV